MLLPYLTTYKSQRIPLAVMFVWVVLIFHWLPGAASPAAQTTETPDAIEVADDPSWDLPADRFVSERAAEAGKRMASR